MWEAEQGRADAARAAAVEALMAEAEAKWAEDLALQVKTGQGVQAGRQHACSTCALWHLAEHGGA